MSQKQDMGHPLLTPAQSHLQLQIPASDEA